MATMIPSLSESQLDQLQSKAETKVYRALRDQLSDDYEVFYSITWILKRPDNHAKDGEGDFVICGRNIGFYVIEVKGGGISFDAHTGNWYSIDRNNKQHLIKDPVKQALNAKYSIYRKLREHPKWNSLGNREINRGHAVFFPNIGQHQQLCGPDTPLPIVGGANDLLEINNWIAKLIVFWSGKSDNNGILGQQGLKLFHDLFAKSFSIKPLLAERLSEEETIRIELTAEQARILDFLRGHRRAAVRGGAGTGKTVLAVEKAKRLANEGFRTLLTCYNRPLADHLVQVCQSVDNLEVMSFHQLCYQYITKANKTSGRDLLGEAKLTYPGEDEFDVQYPVALSYVMEILGEQFDAIVCDEGQDFREEYWMPIELLLTDYENGPLYVFYDDNQNIYKRASTFPIKDAPFELTVNCRNTRNIHTAIYRFFEGTQTQPPTIEGTPIQIVSAANIRAQATKLHAKIVSLINNEGISSSDIVVLIAHAQSKTAYYEEIRHKSLPKPAAWGEEITITTDRILIDTVNRFKGLESQIVFLWGLDELNMKVDIETLYVGMSRAKSLLYLVGNEHRCDEILSTH